MMMIMRPMFFLGDADDQYNATFTLNCSDCSSTTPALLFVDSPCVLPTSSRSDNRYHDDDNGDNDCDDASMMMIISLLAIQK